VIIPPNSSATVFLHGDEILLDDAWPAESEFAKVIYDTGGKMQIQLGSGSYKFDIK
jgi:hypothetical protein